MFLPMASVFRVGNSPDGDGWNGVELVPHHRSPEDPRLQALKRTKRSQLPLSFFTALRTRTGHLAYQVLSDFEIHHDQHADADLPVCSKCHRKCLTHTYKAGCLIVRMGSELRVVSVEEFNAMQ